MANSNNDEIISSVSPHTIKKFELIEAYVVAWAHKLLEYGRRSGNCNGIVFIDCMCNSGVYRDEETGEIVEGWLVFLLMLCGNKTIRRSRHGYISMIFHKPRSLN